ncbi:MAG: 1,4-dihydroxy-2-naphthoate octaprenyltransferase [Ignavibacteria bacterium RIFOXYB2_FULL_35_12]|nr:MAG: 1,4-dihydroxy-2-naphthoate octaprenyltransferase [Ignavibacteria bacterium GWF2_35_20]OGU89141.1 MAG: 1,4-dihydroxy-2-naphthoate octaprenyltransferase [Ignavibacteria bacterium RIFOXYC12_FULL_35_11]OGU94349.1 MAG: 1,4-dihydroxy-2-naphthoate octaprenyltransferase [Ignavibacteria bacterium RIFOXYB12_FULL_35_14]OGV04703.1 MAG: 1,4-dihydroxy-2-naphthoate octaprenyltransferase [Ignavibacteria bacterium RIFOXYB2_FULL_35_12]OGV35126.1 MAG: 1,4-dihydroxy-2-naphthoate octaprenyltransferase [Igna
MIDKTKIDSWIIASRPRTLLAAFVPVMVGSAVAFNEGKLKIILSLSALLCSLLIQVGTNFTNDLYDFLKGSDTTKRKGPRRVLASGLISVGETKTAIVLTFLTAFLIGLFLVYHGGFVILVIGILSILAGLAYTAGPYPLAYNALGDIFVFMFFGIIGTVGTYYLHTNDLSIVSFISSIPVGALVTNILVVNNYRDIEEDKTAGKKTLAVKLGKNFTLYQFTFLIVLSFLVPLLLFAFFNASIWIFLPYLTLPIAYKVISMIYTLNGTQLNSTLELTARLSAIYGLLFSAGIIL